MIHALDQDTTKLDTPEAAATTETNDRYSPPFRNPTKAYSDTHTIAKTSSH